jgi:hypothetical protein
VLDWVALWLRGGRGPPSNLLKQVARTCLRCENFVWVRSEGLGLGLFRGREVWVRSEGVRFNHFPGVCLSVGAGGWAGSLSSKCRQLRPASIMEPSNLLSGLEPWL